MSKKISWLEQFVEDQNKKLQKSASLNKKAEQVIVDIEDFPNAENGEEVEYNNVKYKVVNSKFKDEVGDGILLEKISSNVEAELTEPLQEEMAMEMGTTTVPATDKPVTVEPERAVQPNQGDVYHIDAQSEEIQKFNNEANETENQIVQENSVDATTPEGRVNRVLNRIKSMLPMEQPVEELIEQPAEEIAVEEAPVEEMEETPIEEPVEEPVEEPTEECDPEKEDCKFATASKVDNRILNRIKNIYK